MIRHLRSTRSIPNNPPFSETDIELDELTRAVSVQFEFREALPPRPPVENVPVDTELDQVSANKKTNTFLSKLRDSRVFRKQSEQRPLSDVKNRDPLGESEHLNPRNPG